MAQQPPERMPAALLCPDCGARGILPLAQQRTPDGGIQDPVMICPVCEVEFRAVGVKWLGAFGPPDPTATAEAQEEAFRQDRRLDAAARKN